MPSTIPKSKVKLYPSPASGGGQNTHSTKKGTGTPAVKSKPKKKSAVSSSTTNSCDEKVCELDVPIQEKYKTQTRLGKGVTESQFIRARISSNKLKISLF